MYQIIMTKTPQDRDYPDRYYNLMIYHKILDGTLYDCFDHQYHEEYTGPMVRREYIPEVERAPSVNSGLNLMRSVAEQTNSFLFGEDRFPNFIIDDENTKNFVNNAIRDTRFKQKMQDAVLSGSTGSVAIHLKVTKKFNLRIAVHDTLFLTPNFDLDDPELLVGITEKKKVLGYDLKALDYPIPDDKLAVEWWFQRIWDENEEVWYHPWEVAANREKNPPFVPTKDDARSVTHNLEFCPWVWMRNPYTRKNKIDGKCTFEPAIENCVQVDYIMSRIDRAMKYNSDPLTVFTGIRDPSQISGFEKDAGNAIALPMNADAKLLEISGNAAQASLEVVKALIDEAMASIHGSRADPSKLATSNSSVAQRMLYLPMVGYASLLRNAYGDCGIVPILKMMLLIASKKKVMVMNKLVKDIDPHQDILLSWNDFFPPTPYDIQLESQAWVPLVQAGIFSKETARENMRAFVTFDNPDDESERVKQDQEDDQAQELDHQSNLIDAQADADVKVAKAKPKPVASSRPITKTKSVSRS